MTLVNHATGEIVERDPEEAAAVEMLDRAIVALTGALGEMPITEVVSLKAKVATVQTATKELGMSKEAQELAAEAVRRAEWALGRAIKKGQAASEIRTATDGRSRRSADLPRATDFASHGELYGAGSGPGILDLADRFPEPEQFDAAISEARAEGNLSRANVARKAREVSGKTFTVPRPEAEKTLNALEMYAAKAARAAEGLTPDQIRRIKPKADLWTVGLRESVETLQRLLTSLTEEK